MTKYGLIRGIKFIEHIYDYRKKDFYDFREFINLYDLPPSNFLYYNSIVSSIPKEWKDMLKNETINNLAEDKPLKQLLKSKHANKYLYDIQMQNEKMPKSKSEEKWASDMNCTTLQWNKIYVLPIKCTIDTKLREF